MPDNQRRLPTEPGSIEMGGAPAEATAPWEDDDSFLEFVQQHPEMAEAYPDPYFLRALQFSSRWEGKVNKAIQAYDPGGYTAFGISERAHGDAARNIKRLEDAVGIYYRDYWKDYGAADLAEVAPLTAMAVFDYAVQTGPYSRKKIRRALGLPDDAPFDEVVETVKELGDRDAALLILDERFRHYDYLSRLPNRPWRKMRDGLLTRVESLAMLAMAEGRGTPIGPREGPLRSRHYPKTKLPGLGAYLERPSAAAPTREPGSQPASAGR